MTYVPCSSCGLRCGPNHQDRSFDPMRSSTVRHIGCDSEKCRCGSPHCACTDDQQCMYTRSYAEQSSSSGILLEDVIGLHDGGPGVPVIFGCETRETGEIFRQRADGILGLGNSDTSLLHQLVDAGAIDDVFGLCFGLVEGDGVLLLGDSPASRQVELQYTPMLASKTHPFYYTVKTQGISVNDSRLDIAKRVFSVGYGTVLDSGTTFTYIPTDAFNVFSEVVSNFAKKKGLSLVPGPDPQYEDICFGGAPVHTDADALSSFFPVVVIHFQGNVRLKLGPLNYLFIHTFDSGKYCLGVFDNGMAGTLLGGITFRNILVQYDRKNKRIGFGEAKCKQLGQQFRPPCSNFAPSGDQGSNDDDDDVAAVLALADGDCEPEHRPWQYGEDEESEEIVMPHKGDKPPPEEFSPMDAVEEHGKGDRHQDAIPLDQSSESYKDSNNEKGTWKHPADLFDDDFDVTESEQHQQSHKSPNTIQMMYVVIGAIVATSLIFSLLVCIGRKIFHRFPYLYDEVDGIEPDGASMDETFPFLGLAPSQARKIYKVTMIDDKAKSRRNTELSASIVHDANLNLKPPTGTNAAAAAAALIAEEQAVASGATPSAAVAAGSAAAAQVFNSLSSCGRGIQQNHHRYTSGSKQPDTPTKKT